MFRLVLGGHGLFGLLYSATLRLTAKGSETPPDPAATELLAPLSPCGEPGGAPLRAIVLDGQVGQTPASFFHAHAGAQVRAAA